MLALVYYWDKQIYHPILPWQFNRYGIKDCQVLGYTFIQLEMWEIQKQLPDLLKRGKNIE